jgi:4a-hydroxytetrahydrobiopterin dehydratase
MAERDTTTSTQQSATSQSPSEKTSAQGAAQTSTQTSTRRKEGTYDEVQIQERLKDLPGWYYEDGWIRRQYKTDGWPTTLMLVNTIGYLAEAAYHHPDLAVTWGKVWVKLKNHAAGGVTDKDFELARKIEESVLWRPSGGALEGTPNKFVRAGDAPTGAASAAPAATASGATASAATAGGAAKRAD